MMTTSKKDIDPRLSFDQLIKLVHDSPPKIIIGFVFLWIWVNYTRLAITSVLFLVICLFIPNQLFLAGCVQGISELASGIKRFAMR